MSRRDDAIGALLEQKLCMAEKWSRLDAACKSDLEKATLIASYTKARDLWNEAETKNMVMNEGAISGLLTQLAEVRKRMEDELAALADGTDVLGKIATDLAVGANI